MEMVVILLLSAHAVNALQNSRRGAKLHHSSTHLQPTGKSCKLVSERRPVRKFSPTQQLRSRLGMPVAALGDATGGDVPLSALNQQIAVMNQLMANTPFTFVNAGVTRISNMSVRSGPCFCVAPQWTHPTLASRPAHRRSVRICVCCIGTCGAEAASPDCGASGC